VSTGPDILALDRIGHRFGGFTVLRSVTLSVPQGGLVGLIGPNGSGKTTLFNIISGYLPLQAGTIRFRGEPLTTQSVQSRCRAGLVRTFQTPKIFERMTVLENIMVGACKLTRTGMIEDLLRLPHARSEIRHMRSLAERVAADFGLAADAPAAALPAGPRRILEIARALAGQPKLLMLDEPSAGLNRDEMEQLIAAIRRINQAGLSILLVSHDMELMGVAERVHVLNFGEIIAKGSMAAIAQNADVREVYLGV
jgi:ABC-type branched-subunit amino acid transport system ATPase component